MNNLESVEPLHLPDNIFQLISQDWMLISSGTIESYNMMTASWGGMGELWNKKVSFIFVRPTRYTYGFIEKNDIYTLSFFPNEYRKALQVCGTRSGRDCNKAEWAGIVPMLYKNGVSFKEAKLIITCKKMYSQDLNPVNFIDKEIHTHYKSDDYHRMYIGEILDISVKS